MFFSSNKKETSKNNIVGSLGEDIATQFLLGLSYSVFARNIKNKFGEIDIVCKSPDGVLVFVEVKTLRSLSQSELLFSPEDNMSFSKISILRKTCNFYANLYADTVDDLLGWRIDLVSVVVPKNVDIEKKDFFYFYKNSFIRHYQGI